MGGEMLGMWLAGMALMLGSIAGARWLFVKAIEWDSRRLAARADSPSMRAAMARAQEALPDFQARLASPDAGDRDFMVMVERGDDWLWLDEPRFDGAVVFGTVISGPDDVAGREIEMPIESVIDWSYRAGKRKVGNWLDRA